jgi:predicted nucleic acid-binding Zn finger protein
MQQLTIEHKKSTSNKYQKTEQVEELKLVENKREGHGLNIALTRNIFYLLGSKDIYYVQSERSDNIYYFVKYNPDVFEYCSCLDNSMRGIKCKHIWGLEHAIRKGTLKEIEHLPENAQRYPTVVTKSYRDDDYDF